MRRSGFNICRIVVALLCLVATHSASAGYSEGAEAYQKGDFRRAFDEFESLAKLGHPQSQYILGVMYYRGEGANKNSLLGFGWMKLAAEAGHAKAKELLPKLRADMIDEGVAAAERLVAAFTPSALNERLMPRILPNCDYQSMTAPKVLKAKPPEYSRAARRSGISGSVMAELTIAADGSVRDTRIVRAFPPNVFEDSVLRAAPGWKFEPALKDGVPTTAFHAVTITFDLDGGAPRKLHDLVKDIESKAQDGDAVSQYIYAAVIAGHPDFKKPWSDALPWITKSAQAGLAQAQFELGQSLWVGRGCEEDPVKAVHWLQLAAQQDEPNAQVSLARIALTPGPTFEADKALFWLRRAAEHDHKHARKYLAAILAASSDAKIRNPKQALELLKKIETGDHDEPTTREIRAAAFANSGDFKGAVHWQKAALKRAKSLGLDTLPLEQRLETYNAQQPWYGSLVFE